MVTNDRFVVSCYFASHSKSTNIAVPIVHQIMQVERPASHRRRMIWDWAWKSAVSGLCGSAAHGALMYFKARAGILPSFQPYENFQAALGHLIGRDIHPL